MAPSANCCLLCSVYLLVPGGVSWVLMIPPQGGTLYSLLFVINLPSSSGLEIFSHINSRLEPHTPTLYSQLLLLLLILTYSHSRGAVKDLMCHLLFIASANGFVSLNQSHKLSSNMKTTNSKCSLLLCVLKNFSQGIGEEFEEHLH